VQCNAASGMPKRVQLSVRIHLNASQEKIEKCNHVATKNQESGHQARILNCSSEGRAEAIRGIRNDWWRSPSYSRKASQDLEEKFLPSAFRCQAIPQFFQRFPGVNFWAPLLSKTRWRSHRVPDVRPGPLLHRLPSSPLPSLASLTHY
jgi:hypothetical protein